MVSNFLGGRTSVVWCRRINELVDAPTWFTRQRYTDGIRGKTTSSPSSPTILVDATLNNALDNFPVVDARLLWDMIHGMHMDLAECRYATLKELYLYC